MSVNGQHPGFRTDKFLKVINVTSDNVFFGVFPQQQRLNHAQTVGHILGPSIRPGFVLKRDLVEECVAEFLGNGSGHHLLPDAVPPFAGFCR